MECDAVYMKSKNVSVLLWIGVANCSLWAESDERMSILYSFVGTQPHPFVISGWFCAPKAEVNSCNKDCMVCRVGSIGCLDPDMYLYQLGLYVILEKKFSFSYWNDQVGFPGLLGVAKQSLETQDPLLWVLCHSYDSRQHHLMIQDGAQLFSSHPPSSQCEEAKTEGLHHHLYLLYFLKFLLSYQYF